ncbi:hypothetical protein J7L68_08555 [bacterium]|nr:hypothetical protein [bacterium]
MKYILIALLIISALYPIGIKSSAIGSLFYKTDAPTNFIFQWISAILIYDIFVAIVTLAIILIILGKSSDIIGYITIVATILYWFRFIFITYEYFAKSFLIFTLNIIEPTFLSLGAILIGCVLIEKYSHIKIGLMRIASIAFAISFGIFLYEKVDLLKISHIPIWMISMLYLATLSKVNILNRKSSSL